MGLYERYKLTDVPYTVYESISQTAFNPVRKRKPFIETFDVDLPNDKLSLMELLISDRQNSSTSSSETSEDNTGFYDGEIEFIYDPDKEQKKSEDVRTTSTQSQSTGSSLKGISLEQILSQTGLDKVVRITEHLSNRPGSHTENSHHYEWIAKQLNHIGAYDIAPTSGTTFEELHKKLFENPIFKKWMIDNEFNLLDEYNKPTARATGKHFHLGPDSQVHRTSERPLSVNWRDLS